MRSNTDFFKPTPPITAGFNTSGMGVQIGTTNLLGAHALTQAQSNPSSFFAPQYNQTFLNNSQMDQLTRAQLQDQHNRNQFR